jgi:FlaG/FlaF family flagellin (archaellin)
METPPSFRGDDAAVSPVIGVILIVAITVILAAVIGGFVLNLGGGIEEDVQASATVNPNLNDDEISITWTANQNADSLTIGGPVTTDCSSGGTKITGVGGSTTWSGCGDIVTRVTITASTDEGAKTVIVDRKVDLSN